jgi:hypothetical protein
MMATLTPALIGLFAVAIVLPSLIKLKMPGFEADLQPGSGNLTPGPTGEITLAPGRLTVTSGPTGRLPGKGTAAASA